MKYVFDIDGVVCTDTMGNYPEAKPYQDRIAIINNLHEKGNTIILFTARGSVTGIGWSSLTKEQLSKWKVKYDWLIFGKPDGDIFIDDKGMNSSEFFKS